MEDQALEWKVGMPLPPEGTKFIFEKNVYIWHTCPPPCDCGRPVAFNATSEDQDNLLTTLLRGKDQGFAPLDVLLLTGVLPLETLVHETGGDFGSLISYLQPYAKQLYTKLEAMGNHDTGWLDEMGVSLVQYIKFRIVFPRLNSMEA